jgi:broad specificity phosphatase PhoE
LEMGRQGNGEEGLPAQMSGVLPKVYLVRHGETAWTISGQHTGRTDISLTREGERDAQALSARLKGMSFARVLTSPLQRARRTGERAGFGECAQPDPDLTEWDYGAYEGRRTIDIRAERPGWRLFEDGCPYGETLAEVSVRADRVIGGSVRWRATCLSSHTGTYCVSSPPAGSA